MVGFCAAVLEKSMLRSEHASQEKISFDDISGISCLFKIFLLKWEFLALFKVILGTRIKNGESCPQQLD